MIHPTLGVLGLSGGELVLILAVLLGWGVLIIGGTVAIVYFVSKKKQTPRAVPPVRDR